VEKRKDAGMRDGDSIGRRIATERKLRGLTQRQLAQRSHVSLSLVQAVEQGVRTATATVLAAVARGLGVDRAQLTGQPYRTGRRSDDAVHDLVAAVRRELAAFQLAADENPPPFDLLQAEVAEVSALRHAADPYPLGSVLPGVLGDVRTAAHAAEGVERERVMGLWAEVYYAARQWLWQLGYGDLASVVADRYEWAAAQAADPLAVALGRVFRANELAGAGDRRNARAVMSAAVDEVEPMLGSGGEPAMCVYGFLQLMSAWTAAHAADTVATWAHHAEADDMSRRIGADRDDYRLAFGPTNVGIWSVALAVETLDGRAAATAAGRVVIPDGTPRERVGHHWIDVARAQLLAGDTAASLAALSRARSASPEQVRAHPLARETVYALARRERHASDTVRGLAAWMGLQD
jgi:transcriptional regulator with XRE-family HTH domain